MADLDTAILSNHLSIPKSTSTNYYIWLTENQTSVTSPAIIKTTESHNMSMKPTSSVNTTIFNNAMFTRVIQCL